MKKIPAPARHACTSPYLSSTTTNAAAQRNAVVMNRAKAAIAASDVCRTAMPVETLKSSIMRGNIATAPVHDAKFVRASRLPAPDRADDEAEAERDAHRRERTLRDDVFERFLDRIGGILRRAVHRAAALGSVVER